MATECGLLIQLIHDECDFLKHEFKIAFAIIR